MIMHAACLPTDMLEITQQWIHEVPAFSSGALHSGPACWLTACKATAGTDLKVQDCITCRAFEMKDTVFGQVKADLGVMGNPQA